MKNKLPERFIQSLTENPGFEERSFVEIHEAGEQITSLRINSTKLKDSYPDGVSVPWSSEGVYLQERPLFTADPLFHAGCYYVQEASSMFLEQALKQCSDLKEELKVLDLCAAPGGKSTLISSLISEDSLLVANEIIKSRIPVLCDNLIKWGKLNTYVSNNDPKDFERLPGFFDVMVVDAPCSGSGMFRKDPAAIEEWSEDAVTLCSQRQRRILANVYPALKQDGILIYSTCSYSIEENEAIADWLSASFNMESIRLKIDKDWGIFETQSEQHKNWGYRFYPNQLKGEGFFLACFRKREGGISSTMKTKKHEPVRIPANHIEEIKKWIESESNVHILPFQDSYMAIPQGQENDLAILQERLYLKKSGTRLGKFANKDFIPDHELALSLLAAKSIQRIELNREQAIAYLKKQDIQLKTDLSGWALVCFESQGLGWAKVLPNRINNYYPKEWRIVNQQIV